MKIPMQFITRLIFTLFILSTIILSNLTFNTNSFSEYSLADASLSDQVWEGLQQQIVAAQYQVTWQRWNNMWAYRATNPGQQFLLAFDQHGLSVTKTSAGHASWEFGLSLLSYGNTTVEPLDGLESLAASKASIEYRYRHGITEWFKNTPKGVEHGLNLASPPPRGAADVVYAISGNLQPRLDQNRQAIYLSDSRGQVVLRYDQLHVVDAAGFELPSHMELFDNGRIRIVFNDKGAIYPLTVDPLLYSEVVILQPSSWQVGDYFGLSSAINGDTLVVGSPGRDDSVLDAGAAYVFTRNQSGADQWGLVTILYASDREAYDAFGYSVTIHGDTIAVGAINEDSKGTDAGAVYIFTRNQGGVDNWGEIAIVYASDAAAGDNFGLSVSISANALAVGAPNKDDEIELRDDAGAAYVYERNEGGIDAWGEVVILHSPSTGVEDLFGKSLSLSGDRLVVGAPYDDGLYDEVWDTGAAFLYARNQGGKNNWGQVAVLRSGVMFEYTGFSVSLDGDTLALGAPLADDAKGEVKICSRNQGGADHWGQIATLHASDAQADDELGFSVSISYDKIIAGAWLEDGGAGDPLTSAGAAYIFERNQGGPDHWGQVSILHASNGQAGDVLGFSVANSGDTLVVGAPKDDTQGGLSLDPSSVYIFTGEGVNWREVNLSNSPEPQVGDLFGHSIAIDHDTLVIGAPSEDGGGGNPVSGAGATYIFTRNITSGDGWGNVKILRPSDPEENASFGHSVAISGDAIIVSAPYKDKVEGDWMLDAGAAYLFKRNQGGSDNWGQVVKLQASDQDIGDQFGIAVAISGDTIAIGADGEDGGNGSPVPDSGAVYIFNRNKGGADFWGENAVLHAINPLEGDRFGSSIALDLDTLVVGAPLADVNEVGTLPDSGLAYIFIRNHKGTEAWGFWDIIYASNRQALDKFGTSVAIANDVIVVGAPYADDKVVLVMKPLSTALIKEDMGAAYIFRRNEAGLDEWGETRILYASDAEIMDYFGQSVAISYDKIVVGAYAEDGGLEDPLPSSGAAYIFKRNHHGAEAWGEDYRLRTLDRQANDEFGYSVAVSGDIIVVGAPLEDGGSGNPLTNCGAANIYYWFPYEIYLPVILSSE